MAALRATSTRVSRTSIPSTIATDSLTTSATGHLNFPRWYGSLISLGGGQFLEIGGDRTTMESGGSGDTGALYAGVGWKALPGASSADIAANWFYPRVWMSSNGTIFGFSTMAEGDNAGTVFTINTSGQGSVTNLGHTPFESETYDPAAMFAPDKILTIDKNGNGWIMDISGATPTFTQTGGVGSNRAWSNLTDLADGTVLLTGGSNGLGPAARQCCDRDEQRRDLEPRHRPMDQRRQRRHRPLLSLKYLALARWYRAIDRRRCPWTSDQPQRRDLHARLPAQRRWQSAHRSAGDHQRAHRRCSRARPLRSRSTMPT